MIIGDREFPQILVIADRPRDALSRSGYDLTNLSAVSHQSIGKQGQAEIYVG